MAFTVTQLANVNDTGSAAASRTTGALSIPAGSVVLVLAGGASDFAQPWAGTNEIVVTDSVDGVTGWTAIGAWAASTGDLREAGQLFYKKFPSAVSRTVTADRAGSNIAYWGIEILAVEGVDATNPIVQTKSSHTYWGDNGNAHTDSVTLDSAPTSGNCVIWFCSTITFAVGAKVLPSGYTSVINPSATNLPTAAAYHLATTTAAVGSSDLGEQVNAAVTFVTELAAAAAPSQPVTANFTGSGLLTAAAVGGYAVAAALGGSGTLSATATGTSEGAATAALNGTGTLAASVTARPAVAAALTGTGTLHVNVYNPDVVTTHDRVGTVEAEDRSGAVELEDRAAAVELEDRAATVEV